MSKEKPTTSKLILFGTLITCGIFMAIVILAWVIWDRSDAAGLAAAIATIASIVIGFYEWKAKAENLSKYGKKDDITMN